MGRTYDEMLQAAEAEVRRIGEEQLKMYAERDAAQERVDQIELDQIKGEHTPEEEAELSRRVEIAEQECRRINEQIDEAELDFQNAQEEFDRLLVGADDDDDDPTGERLNVHDAADIWFFSGMDEDRMFGYTEDELRRAFEEE